MQDKRQYGATCQAFVDWAGELGEQASEDLDDESKEILKIRIEKFTSAWDVFTSNVEDFSQNNAEVRSNVSSNTVQNRQSYPV